MPNTKNRYIINEKGKRVGIILDVEQYQKMLSEIEELEEIRAYDRAKESRDEAVPFEQAIDEIKRSRK